VGNRFLKGRLSASVGLAFQAAAAVSLAVSGCATEKKERPRKETAGGPEMTKEQSTCSTRANSGGSLPKVLIIGDSISMGYIEPLKKLLKDKAVVRRNEGNARHTIRGLKYLDEWLGHVKWDVIHFNFGLHDLKGFTVDGVPNRVSPPDQYEKRLRIIVQRLKQTGAKLIWASTTPVPEGCTKNGKIYRRKGDEVMYNAIAKKIMDENGVFINDLHAFAMSRLSELQRPSNVHFNAKGHAALAEQVAAAILTVLNQPTDRSRRAD